MTNKQYGEIIQLLETPHGQIIAGATLSAVRDSLKFHLNEKIEKANAEIMCHNNFGKCEYYLGVKDTATEIIAMLERMDI